MDVVLNRTTRNRGHRKSGHGALRIRLRKGWEGLTEHVTRATLQRKDAAKDKRHNEGRERVILRPKSILRDGLPATLSGLHRKNEG